MTAYRWHCFDVDGTLLDTNGVKSEAFYRAALPYGEEAACRLMEYHRTAGSIGREARWRHFFREILGRPPACGELDAAIERCTAMVRAGTFAASLVPGALEYLEALGPDACVVVSGIEQMELLEILAEHRLLGRFAGVWGGPRTKPVLLRDLICSREIETPAVYYGDVEEDLLAARNAGLDFVWVRGCSEWAGIRTIEDFRCL